MKSLEVNEALAINRKGLMRIRMETPGLKVRLARPDEMESLLTADEYRSYIGE